MRRLSSSPETLLAAQSLTTSRTPQLALAARKIKTPYIASGGIGDGRGLAAAISLGAQGVNCGTVFMATKESYVHDNIKQAMVKADERSTTHIFRTLRKCVCLRPFVLWSLSTHADASPTLVQHCARLQEQDRRGGCCEGAPPGRDRVCRDPACAFSSSLWYPRLPSLLLKHHALPETN